MNGDDQSEGSYLLEQARCDALDDEPEEVAPLELALRRVAKIAPGPVGYWLRRIIEELDRIRGGGS